MRVEGRRASFELAAGGTAGSPLRLRLGRRALGAGKPTRFTLLFYAHGADYRASIRALSDAYPRYFRPALPRGEHEGAFWYHHIHDHPPCEEMALQRVRFLWSSFWFTYLGEYPPAAAEWRPYTYARWWRLGETMSDAKIRSFAARMHERGIGVFAYFNVTELGGAGPEPALPPAPAAEPAGPPHERPQPALPAAFREAHILVKGMHVGADGPAWISCEGAGPIAATTGTKRIRLAVDSLPAQPPEVTIKAPDEATHFVLEEATLLVRCADGTTCRIARWTCGTGIVEGDPARYAARLAWTDAVEIHLPAVRFEGKNLTRRGAWRLSMRRPACRSIRCRARAARRCPPS